MANSYDELVICPYNPAHKPLLSRLQYHLTTCRLDHLDVKKKMCPFNATHVINEPEMNFHLLTCEDRGSCDRFLVQSLDKNNPYKGQTAVPPFSDPIVDVEENWNFETSPVTTTRPPPPGAVIEPPPLSKPSERRALYESLHQMHPDQQNNEPLSVTKPVPRQPNIDEINKVKHDDEADARNVENLGLGQGKSRIAANFQNLNSGAINKSLYSNIVKDMSNLGLGRGQPANQVPMPAPTYDEDDFPVLGCGRGAFSASNKNPRSTGTKPKK